MTATGEIVYEISSSRRNGEGSFLDTRDECLYLYVSNMKLEDTRQQSLVFRVRSVCRRRCP